MKKVLKLIVIGLSSLFLVACSSQPEKKAAVKPATETTEVTFYVTRHGKTIFNTMGKVQGWSDTPLTAEGIEVAEFLGKGLKDIKFDSVYTSDSGRARETAKIVMAAQGQTDLEINEEANFREMNFGKFEGELDEEMWNLAAEKLGFKNREALMPELEEVGLEAITNAMAANDETGTFERYEAVRARFQKELKEIGQTSLEKNQENILVVSHGMAISSLLSDLTEENTDRHLPNASVSKVIYKDGALRVESIGETSYIEKGESLP